MTGSRPTPIPVAIYTRKSTDDGLEQEFNSLDAQYEAALTYINHRQHLGWQVMAERYDDGGYTGGTLERPALQRLLRDIERGGIQVVVTYKLDRISRSLIDFAQLMTVFERTGVAFVSVTQEFDSSTSVGRLTLNVLSSFAQYEREIIRERTRDKMAASRRRGIYTGGIPPFGYALNYVTHKLMIDPTEAAVVQMVFSEYLQRRSVTTVMQTLNTQAIPTKRHTAATGRTYAGGRWSKAYVRKLLANPLYIGHVRYRGEIYPGQHEAIIDTATWQQVQALLGHDARPVHAPRHAALLRGRIRCGHCGCAMTPSCSRSGDRVYRYYLCSSSHRFATRECPNRSIPAGTVEMAVVDQVMQLMQAPDPLLTQLHETQNTPAQRQQVYLLCATLHHLKRTWGTLQPAAQQETIRRLVRQVTVYPDRVDLEFASDEMLELTGGEGAHG